MNENLNIERVHVNGFNVAYARVGKGEKVAVVCQGWATNFEMYEIVANAISDDYEVILFDFPGFGKTPEPEESWSVDEYASFFIDFLRALNVEEVTLIGHSYGGRVIIEVASNDAFKERVQQIVLIDSAGVMPQRSNFAKFKTATFKAWKKVVTFPAIHSLFPEVIDYWISKKGSEDYRNATPVMKGALVKAVNYNQKHLMASIDAPTLLIWGENDGATPVSDGKIMEEEFQDASLVVMKGVGHFSYAEDPQEFVTILRAFLC